MAMTTDSTVHSHQGARAFARSCRSTAAGSARFTLPARRRPLVFASSVVVLLGGCASGRAVTVTATPGPAGSAVTASSAGGRGGGPTARANSGWRIDAREHVDLWLHGFAMLQDDPSLVPYFRPGYRSGLLQVRPIGRGQLDINRELLQRRFAENANLTSSQFLALYFASWDDLRRGVERFLLDEGDVRVARNQDELRMYATIRTYFPTAADRDWLRLFVQCLNDERNQFYRAYWIQQEQRRAGVRAAVESLWSGAYGTALTRFIRNSMQPYGSILLSLPLGGEGRTLAVGGRDNFVTVAFPNDGADPLEALYTIAHEVVGTVATAAVRDHSSAADERSGDAGRWTTLAAVRGGAMLLARIAPELLAGYERYYLTLARAKVEVGDPTDAFARTFPLPSSLVGALERQIEIVMGGI